jgi:hypothetical protein
MESKENNTSTGMYKEENKNGAMSQNKNDTMDQNKIQQTFPITKLPPEMILEIAKHDPAITCKLALTCKEINGDLQGQLNQIRKIIERNNKLYDVEKSLGNLIAERGFYMNQTELKKIINIIVSGIIFDDAQCINCGKFKRERKIFYTEHVCIRCAHKVYNDPDLIKFDRDPSKNFPPVNDDIRVFFSGEDKIKFDTTGYFIFSIVVNEELVTIMYKEDKHHAPVLAGHEDDDDEKDMNNTYPSDDEEEINEITIRVNNSNLNQDEEDEEEDA